MQSARSASSVQPASQQPLTAEEPSFAAKAALKKATGKNPSPPMAIPGLVKDPVAKVEEAKVREAYKRVLGVTPLSPRNSASPEEGKTVITKSLEQMELQLQGFRLERKEGDETRGIIRSEIKRINPGFHELNDGEILLIARRIHSVFTQKKLEKNLFIEVGAGAPRRIYFDVKEQAAYIYMKDESQRQFVKIKWNQGIDPKSEVATQIASLGHKSSSPFG